MILIFRLPCCAPDNQCPRLPFWIKQELPNLFPNNTGKRDLEAGNRKDFLQFFPKFNQENVIWLNFGNETYHLESQLSKYIQSFATSISEQKTNINYISTLYGNETNSCLYNELITELRHKNSTPILQGVCWKSTPTFINIVG